MVRNVSTVCVCQALIQCFTRGKQFERKMRTETIEPKQKERLKRGRSSERLSGERERLGVIK